MNVSFTEFPVTPEHRAAIRKAIRKSLGIRPDPNALGLPGIMPALVYQGWRDDPEVAACFDAGFHITPGDRRCVVRILDPGTWDEVLVAEGAL